MTHRVQPGWWPAPHAYVQLNAWCMVARGEVDAIERSLELRDATLRRVQFDGFSGTFDLAPGTYVQDFKAKSTYRVPRPGEEQGNDVVHRKLSAEFRHWGPFRIGLVVFNLTAVGGLIWGIVRWNRIGDARIEPASTNEPGKPDLGVDNAPTTNS